MLRTIAPSFSNSYSRIRSRNAKLNVAEFESGATYLASMPRMLFLELTENCNLRCPMCRSAYQNSPEKNMPFPLFKRIADELLPYAEVVDMRGWGESTIRPDFLAFVDYARQFGCQLKIITNLSVKNKELWRYLVENDFLIGVSFDGGSKRKFEEIRRGSRFSTIMKNLTEIVRYGKEIGQSPDSLYLLTVVQGANLSEIRNIVEIAGRLGITLVKLSSITTSTLDPNHLTHHSQRVQEMLDKIKETAEMTNVTVELTASLDDTLAIVDMVSKRCVHPWMYCYINYRGQVGFCDHLIGPQASRYLLGDLTKDIFRNIWNNEHFRSLRSQHLSWRKRLSQEFEECNWCYRNRYVDFEYLVYPSYNNKIVSTKTSNILYMKQAGTECSHGEVTFDVRAR